MEFKLQYFKPKTRKLVKEH